MNVAPKLPSPASNITYNSANQMLSFNGENLSYDLNGNLIQKGDTVYTWDARNRLIGIANATMTASFKYDALGKRIEKTINGKTIQYLYDGLDIVQEIENGTGTVNYIRTLNIDEPLIRIKADGTIRYYQQDALGSVVALTDENGVVRTQYIYDPFGNTTVIGEPSDNPFQFAGRENDETTLLFERNRYYSFELQRYIAQDPIGLTGGDVNFYSRAGNNPVNFIDPLGLYMFPGGDLYGKCMEKAPKDCKQKYDNCMKNCKSNPCSYERWKDPFNRHCEMVCTDEYIACFTKKMVITTYCRFRYIPNPSPRPVK